MIYNIKVCVNDIVYGCIAGWINTNSEFYSVFLYAPNSFYDLKLATLTPFPVTHHRPGVQHNSEYTNGAQVTADVAEGAAF